MTNKEAIKIINNMANYKLWEVEALYMAIKALEQEPCKEQEIYEKAYIEGYDKGWSDGNFIGANRWIPVSKKPQKGRYLCTYENYDGRCVDFGSFDGEEWYIKPIAYMPIPEPYKAEEER